MIRLFSGAICAAIAGVMAPIAMASASAEPLELAEVLGSTHVHGLAVDGDRGPPSHSSWREATMSRVGAPRQTSNAKLRAEINASLEGVIAEADRGQICERGRG